jgi:hypothetical protein
MAKKQFEIMAYYLEGVRPGETANKVAKLTWAKTVIAIANSLAEFNPKFNRNKFYTACGGIDEYLN